MSPNLASATHAHSMERCVRKNKKGQGEIVGVTERGIS